ncbi:MAG TPA: hypothetical protein VIG06_14970 [Kofleriaceae bacterium]|jgi:hypothetical protein
MLPISNDSLETSNRRWALVAAVLAALFVVTLLLLGTHASPTAAAGDIQALDNGL